MGSIYLGHPAHSYEGDPADLVKRWANLSSAERCGWEARVRQYAHDTSVDAKDFTSMVMQKPGPVVLLRPIQHASLENIRRRLAGRVPVLVEDIYTDADLVAAIDDAVRKFESGHPMVAQDIVVALLVMEKLCQQHMWGGYAKSYMWSDDIPKGRGVPEKYAARVPHVINILFQREVLIQKTSQGSKKYALNPEHREKIHEYLRQRKLPDEVEGPLSRHGELESVRALDGIADHAPPDR